MCDGRPTQTPATMSVRRRAWRWGRREDREAGQECRPADGNEVQADACTNCRELRRRDRTDRRARRNTKIR